MHATALIATAAAALVASLALPPPLDAGTHGMDAAAYCRRLGRGVNLGNALEAPREGEWGVTLQPEFFEAIQKAGFQSVRVPIRWSAHAALQPPYSIREEFFRRVDWVLDQALARNLAVVIVLHHYEEMAREPDAHAPRLIALWRQIAERYRERPDLVAFELLNEPNRALTDERWNRLVPQLLAAVRQSNPRRVVIVGPANWNHVTHLERLRLPDDPHLIATFHYYEPFRFTHQGAEWVSGSQAWLGTRWEGTEAEVAAIRRHFDLAAEWGRTHRRPIYLGEFGAYSKAEMPSRVRWTATVAREAERRGFATAYWEFCAGFGVYDLQAKAWREPLLRALLARDR